METLTLINGNGQPFTTDLPLLVLDTKHPYNKIALAHIKENTGLDFVPHYLGHCAQPTTASQIAALFLTYNFKTKYYNNFDYKNTLMLRSDHHVGYDVESICYSCAKANHISTNGLRPTERLAC